MLIFLTCTARGNDGKASRRTCRAFHCSSGNCRTHRGGEAQAQTESSSDRGGCDACGWQRGGERGCFETRKEGEEKTEEVKCRRRHGGRWMKALSLTPGVVLFFVCMYHVHYMLLCGLRPFCFLFTIVKVAPRRYIFAVRDSQRPAVLESYFSSLCPGRQRGRATGD